MTLLAFCLIASLCVVGAAAAPEEGCPGGSDCTHEAAIGDVHYDTLEEAFSGAVSGNTVTLLRKIATCTAINIADGRSITLDMNGFNIGFSRNQSINIIHGELNITGSGMLYEESPYFAPIVVYGAEENATNYSVITVGPDVHLKGWAGLFIDQHSSHPPQAYGIVANVYGTLESVKDIEGAGGHALYINGSITSTAGNVPRFILDGAKLITQKGNGMYLAGYAETSITDSTITSVGENSTGIEIRAGKLSIAGNTVIRASEGEVEVVPNGNGSTSANVALAVAQHTTKLPIEVAVEGGTFIGGAAFNEVNPQRNEDEDVKQIHISIQDGVFAGIVNSENFKGFIEGGNFDQSVAAYVADGLEYEANSNGVYTYHSTIESAVEAAGNGGSVSMIRNGVAVAPDDEGVHTITSIDGGSEITMTVTDGYVYTLPELDKSGYTFTGWRVNDSNTIVKGGESYPITANTTFTAVWNMIMIPDTYDIAVDQPAHGTVDVSLSNASQGSVITVTATPDEGYELVYITVDGEPISGSSFVMPDHAVEVSALFAEIGKEVNFVDVSRADWFYDYVQYVAQNGLMEGTTRTAFEPNASMTRAMFWTVLARIDGETITGDAWKTLAQTWAVESGISDGTNADALITREQMVTMLYRYAGSPVTGGMAISEFTDGASVSDYATDAVTWALSEGILTGMGDGILAPQGTATRAQAAAMLMRFVEA